MNLELVTVGTELLLGFTVDTNGAHIGREGAALGIRVVRRTSVGDDVPSIRDAVADAMRRTGIVIVTGGLGPTRDDITREAVAGIFEMPLEFDDSVWQDLLARFARMGRNPAAANRTQAMVPRGATVLRNRWGTAPGLWLEGGLGLAILLPGVPGEMRRLLEHEVLPRLGSRLPAEHAVIRSRTLRTTGVAESTLADRLGSVEAELAPLTLAYLPGLEGVDLRVTAWQLAPAEAAQRLEEALRLLREKAGRWVYGEDDQDLAALVLEEARTRGMTLAVAESCTGGMLGMRLTAVPGSSEVFRGGVIAYDNAVKTSLLGVPAGLLAAHGAVSEETAAAMAEGAANRLGTDAAVAVTGVAGPGGGTAEKPVGLVCFATACRGHTTVAHYTLSGDRHEVRARAGQFALLQVLKAMRGTV